MCHKSQPIRPERAEAPSPGHRPGFWNRYKKVALKGQKLSISKLLPFQGDFTFCQHYPGRCPGLGAFGLSARLRLPSSKLMTHPLLISFSIHLSPLPSEPRSVPWYCLHKPPAGRHQPHGGRYQPWHSAHQSSSCLHALFAAAPHTFPH